MRWFTSYQTVLLLLLLQALLLIPTSLSNSEETMNSIETTNKNRLLKLKRPAPQHTRAQHEKKLQKAQEQQQTLQEEKENKTNEENDSEKNENTPEDVEAEVEESEDEKPQELRYNPESVETVEEIETDNTSEQSNLCVQASTCNECLLKDTIVSAQGYSCEWKQVYENGFECVTVPGVLSENGVQKLFTCDDNGAASTLMGDGDLFEEHSTSIIMFIIFMAFVGIGIRLKLQKDKTASSISMNNNTYSSNSTMFRKNNSSISRFRQTETVPLTIAKNEEEWGWEDDTTPSRIEESTNMKPYKDIEMVQQQTSFNNDVITPTNSDDDELQKAIALSLETNTTTAPTTNPVSSNTMKPITSRTSSVSSNNSANNNIPNNKPISTLKPIKKTNSPSPDDIFASVGITAKPTFNSITATKAPPSKANTATKQQEQKTSLSALAQEENNYDDDDITDWGDDDDLDDLLA